jgi:hypothetical protein
MKEFRIIKILAHTFFIVLFVFAVVFYIERILYADGSFYTFKILCFEKFNIESGRYMAFLTQILPLILVKMHAGLKAVMVSYSVSFVVIYYLIFLICMYVFSSFRAGLATTFVLFLGISDCSMYPLTELQLGLIFCVLFYGFLEYYFLHEQQFTFAKKAAQLLFGGMIILMCLFSHPTTLFPVFFILGFQYIDKGLYKNKTIYFFAFLALVFYSAKFLSVDRNSYEGQQMGPLKNMLAILEKFSNINSVHFFLKFILKGIYVLPLLLFLVTIVYYFVKRNYLKLAFIIVTTFGFFIILMVVFSPGDIDVGMEKNIMPLWIFIALPFVHDLLFHKFRHFFVQPLIYTVVVIAGLTWFYRATVIYSDRLNYMKQLIETSSDTVQSSKIIVEKKNLNIYRVGSTWSYANETLLLSSLDGPQNAKTVYVVDDRNQLKDDDLQKNDVYLCVPFWLKWNYSSLNQRYFQLPLQPYQIFESRVTGE